MYNTLDPTQGINIARMQYLTKETLCFSSIYNYYYLNIKDRFLFEDNYKQSDEGVL